MHKYIYVYILFLVVLQTPMALYGILTEQLENVIEYEKIDDMRKVMPRKILSGEFSSRIPALM